MSMSGSAKRVHDEFSSSVATSLKLQDEEHGPTAANADMPSGDMALHVDNASEPRPPKFPRLDHGNRFQKRSGPDAPMVSNSSFGLDSKGDVRDGKSKASLEEKGGDGNSKLNIHDGKGESDAWKDTRFDSSHDDSISSMERFNRNGGVGGISSTCRREQRAEHRDDSREQYKESAEGKWDVHQEKGGDTGKESRSDPLNSVNERGNRNSSGRRDQRYEPKEDVREFYRDRISARVGADHRDWSKRLGRKSSQEEDGELKQSEETGLELKYEAKQEEKDKEQERKTRDDSLKDRDKERDEKLSWWSSLANISAETGKDKWEKGKDFKDKGRDKRDYIYGEKEELGLVKQEMEEFDLTKKVAVEGISFGESSELERKPSKDSENVKVSAENEERERRKDRDREKVEHERLADKKPRDQEKALEDASPEDGERDKDAFVNHNFHQKRRMLRSRGPSQALSRDGRSRTLSKELDGNQAGSETTAITYRPGEYMPELTKLWKDYESSRTGEGSIAGQGPLIEIKIPAKLVTISNHQVRGSQLWGTDVYTDDSDLVAVLMHTGYYRPTASQPPFSVLELRATVHVLPPQDSYVSTLRNNIRSRAWGAASGCSYSVAECRIVKVGGGHIDLEPCLTRISAVAPTLAPASMERTMTTRAASSNAHRQQRFVQEVTIQYNLCNEPWMKYSMSIVADRGLKKSQYTSARLRKGEVLYLETHRKRYELSYDGEKMACNGGFGATTATSAPIMSAGDKNKDKENEKALCNHNGDRMQARGIGNNDKGHAQIQNGDVFDHYKWAICKQPLPLKVMLSKGVPLPHELVEVLESGLAWEEIQWSQTSVWVRGKEYPLARAQFLSQNLDNLE